VRRLSAAFVLAAIAAGLATGQVRADRTAESAATPVVRVVMTEYKFNLAKKVVHVGKVTFLLVNKGTLPHNMSFTGPLLYKKAPLVDPGSTYKFTVVFKKPGVYHFVCTPHFKLGMASQIAVRK
jgi:plastocyanin